MFKFFFQFYISIFFQHRHVSSITKFYVNFDWLIDIATQWNYAVSFILTVATFHKCNFIIKIISVSLFLWIPRKIPRKNHTKISKYRYTRIPYSCEQSGCLDQSRPDDRTFLVFVRESPPMPPTADVLARRYTYIRVRFKMPPSNAEYRQNRRRAPPRSVNSFAGRAPVCREVADASRKGLWSINAIRHTPIGDNPARPLKVAPSENLTCSSISSLCISHVVTREKAKRKQTQTNRGNLFRRKRGCESEPSKIGWFLARWVSYTQIIHFDKSAEIHPPLLLIGKEPVPLNVKQRRRLSFGTHARVRRLSSFEFSECCVIAAQRVIYITQLCAHRNARLYVMYSAWCKVKNVIYRRAITNTIYCLA